MPAIATLSLTDALGMDRCWSVPLLAACANLLFSMADTNGGLFYVLFMDKFEVSREAAAWPKTVCTVAGNFMGFVIGAAQQKAPIYNLIVAGAVLCPAAIIASAFVPSMQMMTLTFGFFYGISKGTLLITLSVYVVSYFDKYRSVATGMNFLGISLSGIIGPLLLSFLDSQFDLTGTLLVLGGLNLNVIPLVLLLRNPSPIKRPRCCCGSKTEINDEEQRKPTSNFTERSSPHSGTNVLPTSTNEGMRSHYSTTQSTTTIRDGTKNIEIVSRLPENNSQLPSGVGRGEGSTGVFLQIAKVLRTPIFYVILLPVVASEFTLPLFAVTIVDYARDKNVPVYTAAMLVTCLCVASFCGLLLIPVLADNIRHGRPVAASCSSLVVALCFMLMPYLERFSAIAVVTVALGLQQGYLATMRVVLTADYLGNVPITWGLIGLASLPLTFCEPFILGLFRDTGGSYDSVYQLCSGIEFIAALLYLVSVCVNVKKSRNIDVTVSGAKISDS